ncbi:MAG: hypothetical protein VKJ05_04100 [Synechococcaceae cyanobacterium]|nr:hypothetical protein [Synechococcaceae cyanobacterium]
MTAAARKVVGSPLVRIAMRLRPGLALASTLFMASVPWINVPPSRAKPITCPDTWTGIKCDYYKDGYKAGRKDRNANMSMAHERHNDAFDSRNESYFQAGYEDGWNGSSN